MSPLAGLCAWAWSFPLRRECRKTTIINGRVGEEKPRSKAPILSDRFRLRLRQASSLVGKKPLLQAAINPIRRVKFQGESEIVNQNPHECYRSTVRDWMAYETTFGSIYVRQAGETLGVQIESDLDHEGFENAIEAVRLAFGFIEGRSIESWVARRTAIR